MQIQVGDRWSIIGASGSGKTTFSRQLLMTLAKGTRGCVPIYILDTKNGGAAGDFKAFYQRGMGQRVRGNTLPKLFVPAGTSPFLVWQPEDDDLVMYEEFLQSLYKAKNPLVVYYDELGSLTNATATKFPASYDKLLKQGRGLNKGSISVTQSPSYIPPNLLRQTTHVVRMHINDEYDAKKLGKVLGRKAQEEPVDEYGFFYRNCMKPIAKSPVEYYKDYKEFFGLS